MVKNKAHHYNFNNIYISCDNLEQCYDHFLMTMTTLSKEEKEIVEVEYRNSIVGEIVRAILDLEKNEGGCALN